MTNSARAARDLAHVRSLLEEIDALPLVEQIPHWPMLNRWRIREMVERIDADAKRIAELESRELTKEGARRAAVDILNAREGDDIAGIILSARGRRS